MVVNTLSKNFNYFFKRLNPSPSFVQKAAREHENIRALIENPNGYASILSPKCFLQGSYKQDTAIDTNDIDIVVLCELWQPGSGRFGTKTWSRDEIFNTIAAPLFADGRYRDKVRYHESSMCIKVDLGIKVEILPVVYKQGNTDATQEPFHCTALRNKYGRWICPLSSTITHMEEQYAKNRMKFQACHKVFKHLRSQYNVDAVSFHIECLLSNCPITFSWEIRLNT